MKKILPQRGHLKIGSKGYKCSQNGYMGIKKKGEMKRGQRLTKTATTGRKNEEPGKRGMSRLKSPRRNVGSDNRRTQKRGKTTARKMGAGA